MNAPSSIQIENHSNKKQGFTLVELIVVIVIILILAAVLVPQLLRYVDRAQAAVCAENRHTVYIQVMATHTDGTHETLTDAFNALSDNEKEACPSGGVYSIVVADDGYSAEITCSIHTDGASNDDEGGGDSGDETPPDNGGDSDPVVNPTEGFMVGDYYVRVTDQLANKVGKTMFRGEIFHHDGTYYVALSQGNLSSLNNITGQGELIEVTSFNIVSPASQAKKGEFAIRNGALCIHATTNNYSDWDWPNVNATKIN